jgi:hypothetical protein
LVKRPNRKSSAAFLILTLTHAALLGSASEYEHTTSCRASTKVNRVLSEAPA